MQEDWQAHCLLRTKGGQALLMCSACFGLKKHDAGQVEKTRVMEGEGRAERGGGRDMWVFPSGRKTGKDRAGRSGKPPRWRMKG